ncbi:MAG: hypothetical protein IPK07_05075 [Deltaproteobacteria bacterium]|nr:hypothetical protein [Deltaproteobacteria bacterium]
MTATVPNPFAGPRELLDRLIAGTDAIEAALTRGDGADALDRIRAREILVRSLGQQLAGAPRPLVESLRERWTALGQRDRQIELHLERLRSEASDALRSAARGRKTLGSLRTGAPAGSLLSDLG